MKRLHVIMSIGCFLIEMCATFFSLFALHRVLAGGFDTHADSTAALLMRELEFEYVAVCSYSFAGAWLLMGPVAIRCFCMVQQGLRSDTLAAAVCCLIVGTTLLVLSFFNAHLVAFPYDSYDGIIHRFIQLSLTRCQDGGRPAVITALAWTLQAVSVFFALFSLIETFPWNYYRELDRSAALSQAAAESAARYNSEHARAAEDMDGLFDDVSDAASDAAAILPKAVNVHQMQRGGGGVGGLPSHGVPGSRGGPSGPPAAAVRWGFGVPAGGTPPPVPSGSLGRVSGSPSPQPGPSPSPTPPANLVSVMPGQLFNIGEGAIAPGSPRADAVAGATGADPPWSLALAQIESRNLARLAAQHPTAHAATNGSYAAAGGPAASGAATRRARGGVSKVSSVASSIFSLDSTVVD